MARKRKKKRWRYIVTISIVLVLLGGLAGTLGWVYQRGVKREGLFDSATRAMRERRYEDAIRLSKQTLAEEPDHLLARELILTGAVLENRVLRPRMPVAGSDGGLLATYAPTLIEMASSPTLRRRNRRRVCASGALPAYHRFAFSCADDPCRHPWQEIEKRSVGATS